MGLWGDIVVQQESISVPLASGDILNMERFFSDTEGPPVLMVHGAIENGRIFYSASGKGLAPFLARSGFDVFVADLRGRGKSSPPIGPGASFGQTEAITEDIPALMAAIKRRRGSVPQHWIAHSWGGVLLTSFLARFPECAPQVASLVYFGSKRTVRVRNLQRLLKVELVWNRFCPLACRLWGYLPARQMGIGSDSETVDSYRQSAQWVRSDRWVDGGDGFDYGTAVRRVALPPIWYLAAANDRALGHPDDVRRFMESAGEQQCRYTVLSRRNGNRHDYDHIDMLTHPDALVDHFPQVVAWLRQQRQPLQGADMPRTFSTSIELRFSDLDGYGHVNSAVYFTYLETARVKLFREEFTELTRQGVYLVVARAECDFRVPILFSDTVEVTASISRIGGASFDLNYRLHNGSGKTFADARTTMVCFDNGAGSTVPVPASIRALYQTDGAT